jgi:hypothetical protein
MGSDFSHFTEDIFEREASFHSALTEAFEEPRQKEVEYFGSDESYVAPQHDPPLDEIEAIPSLEQSEHSLGDMKELEKLDDAEGLYMKGELSLAYFFALFGTNPSENNYVIESWKSIVSSARQGHPVALARCFLFGIATAKDEYRAIALLQESAVRAHAGG